MKAKQAIGLIAAVIVLIYYFFPALVRFIRNCI